MRTALSLIILLSISSLASGAGQSQSGPNDPLQRMNYGLAFAQASIVKKHDPLMVWLGCDGNVSHEAPPSDSCCATLVCCQKNEYQTLPESSPIGFKESHEWKLFEKACLAQLQSERRWALSERMRTDLMTLFFLGCSVGVVDLAIGSNSFGGSFAIFAVLFNAAYMIQGVMKDVFNLYKTPYHPLDTLEREFAIHKCFIPYQMWGSITKHFSMARQNPFAQEQSTNFIQFALGLQTLYPVSPMVLRQGFDIGSACRQLNAKIDGFFAQYEEIKWPEKKKKVRQEVEDKKEEGKKEEEDLDEVKKYPRFPLENLKMSLQEFLLSLINPKHRPSRYTYLYGVGGIGKTHFAKQLCGWLNEIVSGFVSVDTFAITTAGELEGNAERPGVMLRTLCNQCKRWEKGSIAFMDEASWLNDPEVVSAAKRVFNGNMAEIETSYFGSAEDGTELKFDVPTMLFLLAGNDEIKDEALESRFNIFPFPMPKEESLVLFAKRKLQDALSKFEIHYQEEMFSAEMAETVKKLKTYRQVEETVPALAQKLMMSHQG